MQTLHWLILGGLGLYPLILKATCQAQFGKIACSVRQSYCSRERRQFWLALQGCRRGLWSWPMFPTHSAGSPR